VAPYWRDETDQLVVLVVKTGEGTLTAWGIDPIRAANDESTACVFKCDCTTEQLGLVIDAVLGTKPDPANDGAPVGPQPLQPAKPGIDGSPETNDIVVIKNPPSGDEGPKLCKLARDLAAQHAG